MLRFLSQFRHRLLNQSPFSKYLLYAIGEVLLVVIGILLALQLDAWSQMNKERQLEREYLKRLNVDLDRDLNIVKSIERYLTQKEESLMMVRGFIDDPNAIMGDSVITILNDSDIIGTDFPNARLTGTFQEMISSGHLRLIRNTNLRNNVVNYYSFWDHSNLRIANHQSEYPSLVWEITDMAGFFKGNPLYIGKPFHETLAELEIEKLFYRHFMKEVNYMVFTKRINQMKRDKVEELKAAISEELKSLD